MLKTDAVKHYGSEKKLADALMISRQAVNKWGKLVPAHYALEIEVDSLGAVRTRPDLYAVQNKSRQRRMRSIKS
jgi:hypothetical protein